jgi:hypothetical protein
MLPMRPQHREPRVAGVDFARTDIASVACSYRR